MTQPKGFFKEGGKTKPFHEKKGISESDLSISVKGNNDTISVGTKKPNKFTTIDKNKVNEIEMDEITLMVLSDGEFYRKVINPWVVAIAKRMNRGDFEKSYMFSKKSFLDDLGKKAIHRYEEEHGNVDDPMRIDADTRRAIGYNVAEKIFEKAKEEARYKAVDPKRDFRIKRKEGFAESYQKEQKDIETAMSQF